MSEIVSIDISHHQLPLDPPFPASWDPTPRTRFPATVVRVRDSAGRVGVGSGDAMYGFADYASWFIGQDPLAMDQHAARLANVEFHAGRPWPLDLALWDLAGQIRDEPVWRLLGGTSPMLRMYASTAVHRSPTETADVARRLLAEGFDAMKLRFGRPSVDSGMAGGGLAGDLAALSAVRDAVGDALTLMVDCNQGWRMPWDTTAPWTVDVAWDVAQRLMAERVLWMEEPLHRGDYDGMTELRRRIAGAGTLLVAGGELTREPYEFRELLRRGCLDVFQPDAACTQGITGLARLGAEVMRAGKVFTPHTWGNGVGMLANLHLAAGVAGSAGASSTSVGWVEWPYDPPEWTTARRDYPLRSPLVADGGTVTLADRPGLGVELDEERLMRTASERATFS